MCDRFLRAIGKKSILDLPQKLTLPLRSGRSEFCLWKFDEAKMKCKVYISRQTGMVAKFRDVRARNVSRAKRHVSCADKFERRHLGACGRTHWTGYTGRVFMVLTKYKGEELGESILRAARAGKGGDVCSMVKGFVCMLMNMMSEGMYVSDNQMRNFAVSRDWVVVPVDEEMYHNFMDAPSLPSYCGKIMETYDALRQFVLETVASAASWALERAGKILESGRSVLIDRMTGVRCGLEHKIIRVESVPSSAGRSRVSRLRGRLSRCTCERAWTQCSVCGLLKEDDVLCCMY